MSHIKNVQSFEKLLGICTGLGEEYQPGNQKLQVEAMTTLLSQARSAVSELTATKVAYDRAIDQRVLVFTNLPKLATRILSALSVSGASVHTIDNARMIVRKIRGYSLTNRAPIPSEAGTVPVKRRANGQDFVSMMGHWAMLLEVLETEAKYRPAERELKPASIAARLTAMEEHYKQVIQAELAFSKARQERDRILYEQTGNLYEVSALVKGYVKSVYGTQHDWYTSLTQMRFTKYT